MRFIDLQTSLSANGGSLLWHLIFFLRETMRYVIVISNGLRLQQHSLWCTDCTDDGGSSLFYRLARGVRHRRPGVLPVQEELSDEDDESHEAASASAEKARPPPCEHQECSWAATV